MYLPNIVYLLFILTLLFLIFTPITHITMQSTNKPPPTQPNITGNTVDRSVIELTSVALVLESSAIMVVIAIMVESAVVVWEVT